MKRLWLFILLILSLSMSGCTPKEKSELTQPTSESKIELENVELDKIILKENLLVIRNQNKLVMISPEDKQMVDIYELKPGEISLQGGLFEYSVSPSRKYVVWYASSKGFMAVDVMKKEAWLLEATNNWINQKPDFEFALTEDRVYWITEGGAVLNEYDLANRKIERISIPYPFGNAFKVSDDMTKFIYITGYSSSQSDRPRFMYSDRTGRLANTFGTEIELSNRFNINWTPDNKGTLLVNNDRVEFYGFENPKQTQIMFEEAGKVRDIKRRGNYYYLLDTEGYWHKFDFITKKEVARIPMEITRELKRPAVYPWQDNMLLITENMRQDQEKFLRLWTSNYRGQKQILVAKFTQVAETETDTTLD